MIPQEKVELIEEYLQKRYENTREYKKAVFRTKVLNIVLKILGMEPDLTVPKLKDIADSREYGDLIVRAHSKFSV